MEYLIILAGAVAAVGIIRMGFSFIERRDAKLINKVRDASDDELVGWGVKKLTAAGAELHCISVECVRNEEQYRAVTDQWARVQDAKSEALRKQHADRLNQHSISKEH